MSDFDIVWVGQPHPDLEDKIREDVAELQRDGLRKVDDLITHLVEIGDLETGPLIGLHGNRGKIFAEYIADPKWSTIADQPLLS